MRQYSKIQSLLMTVALVATIAGCAATSGQETAGEYLDDTTITTKVKAALLEEPDLKSMQVDVTTFQNVVQLSGFVDKTATKSRAGEIARDTKGVKDVRNDIVVR